MLARWWQRAAGNRGDPRGRAGDVQKQLALVSTARQRAALTSSRETRTAAGAGNVVFAAIAAGKPGAAVAAALRMRQLDPKDADPLISLAGLIASQGMAQQALALLDAAAKLPAKAKAPMGIDVRAVAANNRRLALLLLGHPGQAVGYLQAAARTSPELAEARINLDAAQQCNWALLPGASRGQEPVIADPPMVREDQPADWTTDDEGNPVAVADTIFDLSQRRAWTPVTINLPDTVRMAASMMETGGYLPTLDQQLQGEGVTDTTQESNLLSEVHDPNQETSARRMAVWSAYTSAVWQPELRSVWQSYQAQESQYIAMTDNDGAAWSAGGALDPSTPYNDATAQCAGVSPWDAYLNCGTAVCSAETAALFPRWRAQYAMPNDAELTYEGSFWKYATGLAANLEDPADHQRMLLDADEMMVTGRDVIVGHALNYLQYLVDHQGDDDFDCVSGTMVPPASAGVPTQDTSLACPKQLNQLPEIKVGDLFSVAIHCEEIEVNSELGEVIGGFSTFTFNPKAGTASVFMGVQAGAAGQSLREGAFVTSGPTGLTDAGLRINESTSGPAFMTQSHSLNVSVAGTVPFTE